MIFFITVIRAISAIIITNSHYTGVYPTDLIANGGLLGDVLFFAVSGYCLVNIKLPFHKWYLKRITRIYPPVIIITLIYTVLGFYKFQGIYGFIKLFVYPTYYHFIASIILLYIPYYIIMKLQVFRQSLPIVILCTLFIQLILYVFVFDKSYYHIDNVHNWMIRFLFFIAMLIGAYVRMNDKKFRNKSKIFNIVAAVLLMFGYFFSKLFFVKFSHNSFICQFQVFNQFVLILLLYFIFVSFAGFDSKLEKMPELLKKIIASISSITLEIYLVQYVIIPKTNVTFFPLNWVIITVSVAASAVVLHFISDKTVKLFTNLKK